MGREVVEIRGGVLGKMRRGEIRKGSDGTGSMELKRREVGKMSGGGMIGEKVGET